MHRRLIPNLVLAAAFAASCATRAPERTAPVPRAEPQPGPAAVAPAGRTTGLPVREPVRPARPAPAPEATIVLETAEGEATYYASKFDGRRTASGIVFRNDEVYAAHRTWPFGTRARVTNLRNGRSVIVRIVDRGPHGSSARARRTIIDLSQRIARELDFIRAGRIPVRVEVLEWGPGGT